MRLNSNAIIMPHEIATIVYTDVVGYSKLTGDNQEVALEILEEHNKILDQCISYYSGEVVKKTGDGICALFQKPTDAIKCAIDIQKDLAKRNKLNIKERQIKIRIGIHYGTYVKKDNDVFGDGINLAKTIEPIAPHGGIAISEDLNKIIWEENDIYIREYLPIKLKKQSIMIYEVYLDLITWFKNEKNQKPQTVDSKKIYLKAHDLFHKGDYSSAIKFSTLALQDSNKDHANKIISFICHAFISLGEFEYAKKLMNQIEAKIEDKTDFEEHAHFFKMKANLEFNSNNIENSIDLFFKSLELMKSSNAKYIHEINYNICIAYLMNKDEEKMLKYLHEKVESDNDNEYSILLDGLKLLDVKNKKDKLLEDYINKAKNINSKHLSSLSYRIIALIYVKYENHDKAQEMINISQEKLVSSSEDISDWFQRQNFLDNFLIHKDIMHFSDYISDHFLNLTYNEVKEDEDSLENINDVIDVHKFCTDCGLENESSYKFCINCGNDLQNHQG